MRCASVLILTACSGASTVALEPVPDPPVPGRGDASVRADSGRSDADADRSDADADRSDADADRSDADASIASAPPMSVAELVAAQAVARCEFERACFGEWLAASAISCAADPVLVDYARLLDDAVAAGRADYVPGAFAACLEGYDLAACTWTGSWWVEDLVRGRGARDAGCSINSECLDGLYCTGHERAQCGLCAPILEEGEPCVTHWSCGDTRVCGAEEGACRTFPRIGDLCRRLIGDESFTRGQCPSGSACLGASDGESRCSELAREGERCDDDLLTASRCEYGLWCADRVCIPRRYGRAGAPCGSFLSCQLGLVCSDELCAEPPTRGERCEGLCAGGRCDLDTLRCVPFSREGEACTESFFPYEYASLECAPGLACLDGPTGLRCARIEWHACPS